MLLRQRPSFALDIQCFRRYCYQYFSACLRGIDPGKGCKCANTDIRTSAFPYSMIVLGRASNSPFLSRTFKADWRSKDCAHSVFHILSRSVGFVATGSRCLTANSSRFPSVVRSREGGGFLSSACAGGAERDRVMRLPARSDRCRRTLIYGYTETDLLTY